MRLHRVYWLTTVLFAALLCVPAEGKGNGKGKGRGTEPAAEGKGRGRGEQPQSAEQEPASTEGHAHQAAGAGRAGGLPPGWSKGEKKGWKGQGLPPGLAKRGKLPPGLLRRTGAGARPEVDRDVLRNMGPQAVPFLVEALESQDPELRFAAAEGLGWLGPQAGEAIPSLDLMILLEPDDAVRAAAATALEAIEGTEPF